MAKAEKNIAKVKTKRKNRKKNLVKPSSKLSTVAVDASTNAPKARRRDLQCQTLARIVTGSRLELHIQRGVLSIHRGGNSPGQGLVVERDEVVPGS